MSDMYRWLDIVKKGMDMAAKAGEREAQQPNAEFSDDTPARASVYTGDIEQQQHIDLDNDEHASSGKPDLQTGQTVIIDQLYGPGAGHGVFVAYALDGQSAVCNVDSVNQTIPVEFVSRDPADIRKAEFQSTADDGDMSPLTTGARNRADIKSAGPQPAASSDEDDTAEDDEEVKEGADDDFAAGFDKVMTAHLNKEKAEQEALAAKRASSRGHQIVPGSDEDKEIQGRKREQELYAYDAAEKAKEQRRKNAGKPFEGLEHWMKIIEDGPDIDEGYSVRPGIDRERYTDLSHEGLEGPFSTNSGKVVYYDPRAGKYYDRDTDMYIDHDEYAAMNESACGCNSYDCNACFPMNEDIASDQADVDAEADLDEGYDEVYEVDAESTDDENDEEMEKDMKLNEFGPLVGMAARAGGAAIGSKIADKVMGEDGEELDAIPADGEEGDEWSNGEDDSAKTVYDVLDVDDEDDFVEPTHDKEMGVARTSGAPEDVSDLIGQIDYMQNLGMSMSDRHYDTEMLINMKPEMIKRIYAKVKGVEESVTMGDRARSSKMSESFGDRKVDMSSIEIEGVDPRDRPDFADAFVSYATYTDGTELTDEELDRFTDMNGDLVNRLANEQGFESAKPSSKGRYLQDSVYVNGATFSLEDWDKIADYRESLIDDDGMEPEEAMEVAVDFLGYDLEEVEDFLQTEFNEAVGDEEEDLEDEPEDTGTGIVAVPDADEVDNTPSYDKDMGVARTGGASMDVSDMIGKIAYLQDMGMSMSNGYYDADKLMMMKPEMIERIYHKVLGETKAPNSGVYFAKLQESKKAAPKAKSAPKKINEGADPDVVKALKALFK